MPPRTRTAFVTPGLFLLSVWVAFFSQPTPVRAQVRAAPPGKQPAPSPREFARRLEESVDAGDIYPSPSGWRQLRRLPGVVVVPSTAANEDLEKNWTAPSRPWAGYRLKTKPARHLAI